MHNNLNYYIFIILLALSFTAKAENIERWHWHDKIFKNFGVDQGLPHGSISAICEDNIGFIWLVTAQGLVRFDGNEFKNIPTIIDGIKFSINSMVNDAQGLIWMSTSQGLIRFTPITNVFESFNLFPNQTLSFGTLAIETNGNTSFVWIATDKSILKFNTKTLSSEIFHEKQFLAASNLRVFSIITAKKKTVWLGTSDGLYFKKENSDLFTLFDLSLYLPESPRISALLQISDDSILVATPRNGILKINTKLRVTQPKIPEFSQEWIYSLEEISPGVVWLGTYGAGVIQLDLITQNSHRMRHNRLLDSSLANDDIWTVYRAKNNLIWLATNNGLSLFNPKQGAIKTIFGDAGRSKDLSDLNIKSLAEDKQGDIWFGLNTKGVDIITPTTGFKKHIGVNQNKVANSLPGGAVESLIEQPLGNVVIGSNWGVYQYWQSKLQHLDTDKRNSKMYTGAFYSNNNFLWAGGTDGLWRFTLDGVRLTNAKEISTSDNKFTDQRITIIGKAPNNEILIGTWNGLNWIDESGTITYKIPNSITPLENGFISSFFYDDHDRLWIGTEGAGIYVAKNKKHPTHFTHINTEQGLSSNIVRAMQPDKNGRVWISSIAGIDVIDINSFNVTPLSTLGGDLLPPYYRKASIQTTSDEILFGGSGGVTIIDPKNWQIDDDFSPLVIIKTTVGDKEVTSPLLATGKDTPLIVAAEKNSINIEFTTLDFINNKAINYRYRLQGLSNQWKITDSKHREAAYTTLPPGQYQFEIQNSNRLGEWNPKYHRVYFQVLPFWYQTFIARSMLFLISIVLVMLFIRFRISRLKKQQLILEEQVKLRTLTLEKTAKELNEKSEALTKVSVTDPLTGVNNRRFLDSNLPTDVALTTQKYHDLAPNKEAIKDADIMFFVIDIDHFKKVNDHYGHQAGDLVLIEITNRLKKLIRGSDYLVRWGGEEFLFVVKETSRELAAQFAHRICQQVKQESFFINEKIELSLTCSVGFVPFPLCYRKPTETSWLDCINIADKALYTAKNAGRDAWVGLSLTAPLTIKDTAIDGLRLPLDTIKLESNLEISTVKNIWQKAQDIN